MASGITPQELPQQWQREREAQQVLRAQLIAEQEQLADVREGLNDRERELGRAQRQLTVLDENISNLQRRLEAEQQTVANLQQRLRAERGLINGLLDWLLMRTYDVNDLTSEIARRDRMILELQQEIAAIIRVKNRAIRIRDIVIKILTCSLEIEKESAGLATTIATALTAQAFIYWPWAVITGMAFLISKVSGKETSRQEALQKRIRQLQAELTAVRCSRLPQ